MDLKEIIPLNADQTYDPSEVIMIGVHMNPTPNNRPKSISRPDLEKICSGNIKVKSDLTDLLTLTAKSKDEENKTDGTDDCPTVALIYAYAYEGNTYRLAKPRIMIVKGIGARLDGTKEIPPEVVAGVLYTWSMSKHDTTVSIEVESGSLETLVLNANQPGNRAVNSYAAHMQMSHRGGKLS